GKPAARGERQLEPENTPIVVEADVVALFERMALAGGAHVVVAIEPQLDRAAGLSREDRCRAGEERHLRFLAAERAAHAPAFDDDIVRMNAEGTRDHVLPFARMLRRDVRMNAAAFAGDSERDLSFEVEMILPAVRRTAAQTMRRVRERSRRIPTLHVN